MRSFSLLLGRDLTGAGQPFTDPLSSGRAPEPIENRLSLYADGDLTLRATNSGLKLHTGLPAVMILRRLNGGALLLHAGGDNASYLGLRNP